VADSDDRIWYELASPQQLGVAAPVAALLEKLKAEVCAAKDTSNVQNR
jgi:hypothetical protein